MMSSDLDYSNIHIEILEPHEAVRRRPNMFLGPTDQRGLHSLLSSAVEGLVGHSRFSGVPLDKLSICLESDGSATLTTEGSAASVPTWGLSAERIVQELRRGPFFVVNPLCERLHMTLRGPDHQWRSLLFERGLLRGDESHSCPPDESSNIWLRLWPDFSILEPETFDRQQTLEAIRPFSENRPEIVITVKDGLAS